MVVGHSVGVLSRVVLPQDPARLPLSAVGDVEVLDRRRAWVRAGGRASFAALLSAFPASSWQRWTDLVEVRLQLDLSGDATAVVRRSDADGAAQDVLTVGPGSHELALPLTGFDDGGWYWFDVAAGDAGGSVRAAWTDGRPTTGTATVVVTTHDRPDDVVAVLEALAADPEVLALLDEVLVVDQGSRSPDVSAVEPALGGRLRVLRQANFGGSGGAARGLLEALDRGTSRYAVLLDDDIALEPETLLRTIALADRCRTPTLVGGQMLDLRRPTVLHTPGERVDPRRWLWETVPPGQEDHDLATGPLASTPWLHRRLDVGFNAWWTCLVPLDVVREVGLPLPLFLKWDDVELGVRAGRAGFPTVTLPGAAVWHEPWAGKPDTLGWQAYFHHRNRLVAGLLHSPRPFGGTLLRESLRHTWRPLRAGRADVVALRLAAMRDLLAGPGGLHASLATALPRARELQRGRHSRASLLAGTALLHVRLATRWRRLRRAYRAALPDLVAAGTWRRTLS